MTGKDDDSTSLPKFLLSNILLVLSPIILYWLIIVIGSDALDLKSL